MTIKHEFVEFIPDELETDTLYISVLHRTAIHKCMCGCGVEVVTPISPTDWRITFDGERVSLFPSIGNWSYPCRSHYWIKEEKVVWAEVWTDKEVRIARDHDRQRKRKYYVALQNERQEIATTKAFDRHHAGFLKTLWNRIDELFRH